MASDSPFEQVLYPGAKEEFFQHGDENENARPRKNRFAQRRQIRVGMKVKAVWKPKEERTGAITDIRHFKPR